MGGDVGNGGQRCIGRRLLDERVGPPGSSLLHLHPLECAHRVVEELIVRLLVDVAARRCRTGTAAVSKLAVLHALVLLVAMVRLDIRCVRLVRRLRRRTDKDMSTGALALPTLMRWTLAAASTVRPRSGGSLHAAPVSVARVK